jgi:hypothetical protein
MLEKTVKYFEKWQNDYILNYLCRMIAAVAIYKYGVIGSLM